LDISGQEYFIISGELPVFNTLAATEQLCVEIAPFSGLTGEFRILDIDSLSLSYSANIASDEMSFNGLSPILNYTLPFDINRGSNFDLFQRPYLGYGVYYDNLIIDNDVGEFTFTTHGISAEDVNYDIVYDEDYKSIDTISFIPFEGDILNSLVNAQLLIITNHSYLSEARELQRHKEDLGITTAIVTERDLYHYFSYGEVTPIAIRDAINAIKKTAGNRLRYVLFLNNATLDPKNHEGFGVNGRTPTYHQTSDFFDYPSDLFFGLDKDSDELLDLSIGRIPVNSASQLRQIVEKIINFEIGGMDSISSQISFISTEDEITDFAARASNIASSISSLPQNFTHITMVMDQSIN